jgi:hypothetical protein
VDLVHVPGSSLLLYQGAKAVGDNPESGLPAEIVQVRIGCEFEWTAVLCTTMSPRTRSRRVDREKSRSPRYSHLLESSIYALWSIPR